MIYFGQHAHLSRFPEPPSKKIIVGQNRCLVCISYYPKDTQTTLNVQTGKLMCPTPRMVRGITEGAMQRHPRLLINTRMKLETVSFSQPP